MLAPGSPLSGFKVHSENTGATLLIASVAVTGMAGMSSVLIALIVIVLDPAVNGLTRVNVFWKALPPIESREIVPDGVKIPSESVNDTAKFLLNGSCALTQLSVTESPGLADDGVNVQLPIEGRGSKVPVTLPLHSVSEEAV